MKILITGGLGYIGSHIAHILKDKAIIIDNQCNSNLNYKKFLPKAIVYIKDLNLKSLRMIFSKHDIKSIIHLASLKAVNKSVENPLDYYENNIISSLDLLKAMEEFNKNNLIFSSSATVYGNSYQSPLSEDLQLISSNPYGSTKIIIEQLISDYAKSKKKFKAISLRYFNPIGANVKANLFDKPLGKPQNLMPVITESILQNKILNVFGNDYETKDGTCVRDFIHINDLASAHLLALKKVKNIKGHISINLGLGKGISVLGIIKEFERVNNVKINFKYTKRREGDVPVSYAKNNKAIRILGWKPKYDYKDMVKNAWIAANINH